jgi:DNA-binding response OmpR family regulator
LQKRILIFDDDADLLEVCAIVLRTKNFYVIGKSRCTDILSDIAMHKPDVILMDNWIPDTGGVQATRLVKSSEEFGSIPVIFFSANYNLPALAEEAGAEFYLQKPFEITELEAIVEKAIAYKISLS